MLLDTGGGIKKAATFFTGTEPFLIHNVDILSNADLKEVYDFHRKSQNLATLLVSPRKTSRYLLFDTDNRLQGWFIKTRCKPSRKDLCTNRVNTANMRSVVSM